MATEHAQDDLEHLLGSGLPASVQALPEEVRTRLAAQVRAARREEDRLMREATDKALRGVPLPFRGAVKKALGL